MRNRREDFYECWVNETLYIYTYVIFFRQYHEFYLLARISVAGYNWLLG